MLKRRRKLTRGADISMLNLIDVIFMLLIFFMIATTFNNYTQFQLSIPKTNVKLDTNEITKVEIIIDKNKNKYLKINDKVKELKDISLEEEFSKLEKKSLENVTLTADENLEYKEIVEMMGILKNQSVENINLNIQKN